MRSPATTTNDVMADDFSQGMQIGANLWDRAQTQRRMVDQLNMQVADQVMRQKTADIQNQMQQFNLRDALEEKTNQEADLPVFYDYQKQVSEFLNNPSAEAPMPALPQFKSRTYRMEAEKAAGSLRDVSARKFLAEAQVENRQIRVAQEAQKLKNANTLLTVAGVDVFDPETGKLDEARYKQNLPLLNTATAMQRLPQVTRERIQALMTNEGLGLQDAFTQATKEHSDRARLEQLSPLEKKANLFEETERSKYGAMGVPINEERMAQRKSAFVANGGKLPQLPSTMAKSMEDKFATMESIASLQDEVKAYDTLYGDGAFNKALGVLPTKLREVKSLFETEKDPARKEALGILSDFSALLNQTARTTSGLNVTAGEAERIQREVGSLVDANTLTKLERLKRRYDVEMKGRVNRATNYVLPDYMEAWANTIDVPLTITPSKAATPTAAPSSGAPASLPPGWKMN